MISDHPVFQFQKSSSPLLRLKKILSGWAGNCCWGGLPGKKSQLCKKLAKSLRERSNSPVDKGLSQWITPHFGSLSSSPFKNRSNKSGKIIVQYCNECHEDSPQKCLYQEFPWLCSRPPRLFQWLLLLSLFHIIMLSTLFTSPSPISSPLDFFNLARRGVTNLKNVKYRYEVWGMIMNRG